MRNIEISIDEYYHLYNRGAHKRTIFHDDADYARFLFLILFFQSLLTFEQISRHVHKFLKSHVQHRVFDIAVEDVKEVARGRHVKLICFCLMPNHFHLVVQECQEGGIAQYMQRILNGYTKYYNAKYETSGHLFQGPYKAAHIEGNDQMLYLSTYIHRNPRELLQWKHAWHEYEWSSYGDYTGNARWGVLLATEVILEQFEKTDSYKEFASTSTAKISEEELEFE